MTISAYFRSREALSLQCSLSASTAATVQHTLPLRNAGQSSILRLVVSELEFALLAVASLVEAVVHLALAVLLEITGLVLKCCSQDLSDRVISASIWTAIGAYVSIQNALTCLAALFMSISNYSTGLGYDDILPSYFEYLAQAALISSPDDVVLMPRENNPHLTRLLNSCREDIRGISSASLRGGLFVLPLVKGYVNERDNFSYIDMKITFNDIEFSDDEHHPYYRLHQRLHSQIGPISSYEGLETALEQCKTALIEKLEQRFARSPSLRAVNLVEPPSYFVGLPREVKINCQVTHERTRANAYTILKIDRTGRPFEGDTCTFRTISAEELQRLRS